MEQGTTASNNANGIVQDVDELLIKEVQCYEVMPPYVDPAMMYPILPPPPPSSSQHDQPAPKKTKKVKKKKHKAKHAPQTPERKIIRKLDIDATPRVRNSNKRQTAEQAEQLKDQSAYITYDWSSLKLGQELGSAAWNAALREQLYRNPALNHVPQLTALECLQRIQALRLETIIPPPDSELHQVVQNVRFKDGFEEMSEDSSSLPMKSLGRLYERMVQQQVDDGTLDRLEYQFMTAEDVVSKMRHMETEAASLQAREKRIRRTATTLGLVNDDTNAKVGNMLGYWRDNDKEDSSEGYWREDFAGLLKNESNKTAFLTWHDMF